LTTGHNFPTSHPDVNEVLRLLLAEVRNALGNQLIGLYLYGSLATGDFEPCRSDIDFLVVTSEEVSAGMAAELEKMHGRIIKSGHKWASKLEGSYVSKGAIRQYEPDAPPCPMTHEGHFQVARQGIDWVINRYVIRRSGKSVVGPLPATLISPIRPAELRQAALSLLHDRWAPLIESPTYFSSHPMAQPFTVLTLCRALQTVETGKVSSKTQAVRWATAILNTEWKNLILNASLWRNGDPPGDIDLTRLFMKYVIDRAGTAEN
jgi:predicted nucleotidyltransferase